MASRHRFNSAAGLCLLIWANLAVAQPTTQPDLSKDKTLYVVGYAHLDTQWRWAYPQVIREFIPNTMLNNFPLFEKYPAYVFNFTGSRRYQMMREYWPADYTKVKQYIAAGRWFPAGSSVDEGDANVPSSESIIRHILYGNRFFRQEFGKASDEFMLPDCFGFPAALPSILAHCGIRGFSTQKLTWGSAVGIPFKVGVWEGPDGKSVIAALDPGAYVSKVEENLATSESWTKRVENNGKSSGVYTDYHYFGTGDRGGAPTTQSVEWVQKAVETNDGSLRVICAPADRMFNAITDEQRKSLPRYKGELMLVRHSPGSFSSEAYMKRWNRKNELLADAAERASVAAAWLGAAPYPSKTLEDAWYLLLGSQMHDILPGTSIPKAYEFSWNDEVLAANQFAAVTTSAVGAITRAMNTHCEGVPVVVYNPLSIAREDVVEATVGFDSGVEPPSVEVIGPNGKTVPSQVISQEHGGTKIIFLATMPSVGLAVFDVRPATGREAGELKVDASGLENERFRVALNGDGDVVSVFDKRASRETLAAPARLAFVYHNPEESPAWNMDWEDQRRPPYAHVEGPAKVRIAENGPVRVALEVQRESQGSRFTQMIRLAAGDAGDRIEFDTHVDWRTYESCLKAEFPLTAKNQQATYDIQLGTIQRSTNNPKQYEMASHQWFDLTAADNSCGASVLSDSKYASDKPDDHTLRLTLLYTPGVRTRYQDQASQDIGRHEMLFALMPHAGDWRSTPWAAARLNQPLMLFVCASHEGPLGRQFSILKTSTHQIAVQSIKKAEDDERIIVRLRELQGRPAPDVRVELASLIEAATEVDGQERTMGEAKVVDGKLVADIEPYGLRAFSLKLGGAPTRLAAPASTFVEVPYDTDVVSFDSNRSDGALDDAGRTYPAEQLPAEIISDCVQFKIGPTGDGQKNALACRGQKISLPEGDFGRIYLLASAVRGDARSAIQIDDSPREFCVANWSGYIGQWDNRLWKGQVPETVFDWQNELDGLVPGYVKRDHIAWFCSHRHHPSAGNEYYQYSYLFSYGLDLPRGAKTLTLPNDPNIRVFAITLVKNDNAQARAARPLNDALEDHRLGAPSIRPGGGSFTESTLIEIEPPLYWRDGQLRYTLDGTEPTSDSPAYAKPLLLTSSATIKAREFLDNIGGPVAAATYDVNDVSPPRLVNAIAIADLPFVRLEFSEPLDKASAASPANYQLRGVTIESATSDGRIVTLKFSDALTDDAASITINGVKDTSPAGNTAKNLIATVEPAKPISRPAGALPTQASALWSMNLFVRADKQPGNRTLIAGFGVVDGNVEGTGRYFAKFANGIHFWSHGRDLETRTPLDVNQWQMLTATYDGRTLLLYKNGQPIARRAVNLADDPEGAVQIAPLDPWEQQRRFAGDVRAMTLWNRPLTFSENSTSLAGLSQAW